MSNAMERIKNKIRNSNGASVHAQLIDTAIHSDENVYKHGNDDVNGDVNVNAKPNVSVPVKREKRKKFEELYKRDTFWIKNDLKDQLDSLCKGERGEKTRIINEALREYLSRT